MKNSMLLLIFSLAIFTSCSHGTRRGTVAMKISDDEAHVYMRDGEVEPGDWVVLFEKRCTAPKGTPRTGETLTPPEEVCDKVQVGEGRIEQVLNNRYSVMKADAGSKFREGTIVERR